MNFIWSLLLFPSIALFSSELILLRHGEGEHNIAQVLSSWTQEEGGVDHSLTSKGQIQVAQTAADLLDRGINRDNVGLVLVSPLLRTRQTAQILVDMGVCSQNVLQIEPRIREQIHQDFERKTLSEVRILFPSMKSWDDEVSASAQYGGEDLEHLHSRLSSVLEDLHQWNPEKGHVILVSHGYPISILLNLRGYAKKQVSTAEAISVNLPECSP